MRKTFLRKTVSLKNIIFFETFIWPFYGQSFIKTVRGPLVNGKAEIVKIDFIHNSKKLLYK